MNNTKRRVVFNTDQLYHDYTSYVEKSFMEPRQVNVSQTVKSNFEFDLKQPYNTQGKITKRQKEIEKSEAEEKKIVPKSKKQIYSDKITNIFKKHEGLIRKSVTGTY